VITSDRMVVGDCPARREQGIGGAGFDVPPLLEKSAGRAACIEGVVRGRTVRIDVGETGRDDARPAGRFLSASSVAAYTAV